MVKKQEKKRFLEILDEKWFTFRRVHFTEGFIDVWFGDCADDPNQEESQEEKTFINTAYYRLNGEGHWESKRKFLSMSAEMNEGFNSTAEEVWMKAKL
jgi:hypothetical protein